MLGWAKNLNATPSQILYDISYENLVMYTKATPYYDDVKDEWDDALDANNPDNFKNIDSSKEIYV